ncbi:hypothetical protein CASFOL_004742 [Castilleja foliolosa]|uniref:F-box domain-containing protein n=1 Tax=Castilleja foliolosa TaxID=1961234 RepID=A0ABD3EBD8_9LAMI
MLSIDRLSALPDEVICHILSFLSTKISVQTSILARRWRFLWAHVPNLDLDSKYFDSTMSFSSTINKVMLIRKEQSINTVSINCEDFYFDFDEYELETLISSAIQCNVQNLYLDISNLFWLPQYEALPHLLSGCPVLEELKVHRIVGRDLDSCYISSPTLERLSIDFPLVESGHGRLKINAPRLGYISIYDCSYDQISLSPMPYLTEAHIHFHIYASEMESDIYVYSRAVLKFIDSFCKLKCLKLFGTSDEFLDLGLPGSYVRFSNLFRLELTADWHFISKFLESANNLEVLVIINKVAKKLQNWIEPNKKRCACLLSSLKTVTVFEFGCTEQELNVVRYFLRNAQVLQKMEIYC